MTDIPTVEELEFLFREGRLERLGDGSRRVCYSLPGGKLCVKSYRSDDELGTCVKRDGSLENRPQKPSVVREIRRARFDEKRNTSCQEYRYWKELQGLLPREIFAVFPQTMECVFVPSRGWCVVEERVRNADGSAPESFRDAYVAGDGETRARLIAELDRLVDVFLRYSVRLYDPQNLVVQRLSDGAVRLRLVDFEPATRCLVSVDSFFPLLIRSKTERRVARWLRDQMGVEHYRGAAGAFAKESISMAFSVSDNYSCHLAVVLASVLSNNPGTRFVFHVLHRNLSAENQAMLKKFEKAWPVSSVRFHLVEEASFARFPVPKELEHVTQEMYYRYILPEAVPECPRMIYTDVDILCVGNLRPLWETDLEGNVLAAVSEGEDGEFKKKLLGLTGGAPYVNSGVLVMDLERMRAENATEKLFSNTLKYAGRIAWPDQDVINITFRDRILVIEPIWNGFNVTDPEMKKRVVIRHFANATQKPWCNIWKNTTWLSYLEYLRISPYRAESWRFVWGHIKGFFFFKYTKKGVTRYLVCGIRVWRRKCA